MSLRDYLPATRRWVRAEAERRDSADAEQFRSGVAATFKKVSERLHRAHVSPSLGGGEAASVGAPDPARGGNAPAGDGGAR